MDPNSKPDYAILISAAEKYEVPLWHVVPTFIAFVMREEPLTDVEAALLSMDTVVRLARAREDLLRNMITGGLSSVSHREAMAKRIVYDIWPAAKQVKIDLRRM